VSTHLNLRRLSLLVIAFMLVLPVSASASLRLNTLTRDVPAAYTPFVNSSAKSCVNTGTACREVSALARNSKYGTMYAGGLIDSVTYGSTTYSRSNIFAFDSVTGAIRTGFAPVISGVSGISDGRIHVITMSPDMSALYIGGIFKTVNGQTRRGIAKLDPVSGALIEAFNANIGSDGGPARIFDIKFVGNKLWVAGNFTALGGVTRKALASVDPTTGAVTNSVNVNISGELWPGEGSKVRSIGVNPAGTAVVILGSFTSVSGYERLQVAKFGISSTGAAIISPWYSYRHFRASSPTGLGTPTPSGGCYVPVAGGFHSWPQQVDWAPDGSSFYIAGAIGSAGFPALCDSVSKWSNNSRSNDYPLWINYSDHDTFWTVAATGPYVYAGGHMKSLNYRVYHSTGTSVPTLWYADNTVHSLPNGDLYRGEVHWGLGAFDAATGKAVRTWNDGTGTSRGVGWLAMLSVPIGPSQRAGLWVGGDTETVNGLLRKRIAYFPTS
jgi:Domain of unknown function (DUF5122) beta-propeller